MSIATDEEPAAVPTTRIASPIKNPTPFTAEERGNVNDVMPFQKVLNSLAEKAQQEYDQATEVLEHPELTKRGFHTHPESSAQWSIQKAAVNRLAGIRFFRAVYQRGVDSCGQRETDPEAWDRAGVAEVMATMGGLGKKIIAKQDVELIDGIYTNTFKLLDMFSEKNPAHTVHNKQKEAREYTLNTATTIGSAITAAGGISAALAGNLPAQIAGSAVAVASAFTAWRSAKYGAEATQDNEQNKAKYYAESRAEQALTPVIDGLGKIVRDVHSMYLQQASMAR